MKTRSSCLSFLLLMAIIISGCTQNKNQEQDDIAAISEFYNQYFHFLETDDLDSFMTLWDDNAMRSAPDIPNSFGKEEIRSVFKNIFDASNNKFTPIGETKLEVCGNIAYGFRTLTLTSNPKEAGTTIHVDFNVLTIFKRQPDGSWKLYIDCMNYHPTWSMDSIASELKEDNPYY